MIDSEALQVTLQVTNLLENLGVPYVIGGSMASMIHGMLRTTMDVDIVADIQPEQIAARVSMAHRCHFQCRSLIPHGLHLQEKKRCLPQIHQLFPQTAF